MAKGAAGAGDTGPIRKAKASPSADGKVRHVRRAVRRWLSHAAGRTAGGGQSQGSAFEKTAGLKAAHTVRLALLSATLQRQVIPCRHGRNAE